ncbi:MAG: 5-oxoprolinase subunit PxpA [Agriterribacter sp.]
MHALLNGSNHQQYPFKMTGSSIHTIDLNCDMGEGMPTDEAIMPFISSANIACGYHAGDEATIRKTITLCMRYKVAIGAHPGFADRENFGRLDIQLSPEVLYQQFSEQIFIVKKIAGEMGATLHHVKPHGALYNMAAKNEVYATTLVNAVKDVDPALIFYGLSNSLMIKCATALHLPAANEVFADRTYLDDGLLTPRSQPGALITETAAAVRQALQLVQYGKVQSIHGNSITVKANTICLHGDGAHAVSFAQTIFDQLQQNNIRIETI